MEGFGAIVAFITGWMLAQLGKFLGELIRSGGKTPLLQALKNSFKSGGMPSSHSASFVALSIYLGLSLGFDDPIFALAICTTSVIIYDAINVRYAVGEQGKALNRLILKQSPNAKTLKLKEGHTLPQAIVGSLLGAIAATIVFAIFSQIK